MHDRGLRKTYYLSRNFVVLCHGCLVLNAFTEMGDKRDDVVGSSRIFGVISEQTNLEGKNDLVDSLTVTLLWMRVLHEGFQ